LFSQENLLINAQNISRSKEVNLFYDFLETKARTFWNLVAKRVAMPAVTQKRVLPKERSESAKSCDWILKG
jgi:hypothetical protein